MEIIQFLKSSTNMNSLILMPNYKFRLEVFAIATPLTGDEDEPFVKNYIKDTVDIYLMSKTWPVTPFFLENNRSPLRAHEPLPVLIHKDDVEFFKTYGKDALEYAFYTICRGIKQQNVDWWTNKYPKVKGIFTKADLLKDDWFFRIDELRCWLKAAGQKNWAETKDNYAPGLQNLNCNRALELMDEVFDLLLAEYPDDLKFFMTPTKAKEILERKRKNANTPIKMEPEPPKEEPDETTKLIAEIFDEEVEEEFSSDEEEIIVIKSLDEADKEVARREEKKAHKINQLPEIVAFHKATGFIKEEEEPKREPFIYTDKTGKDWSSADPYPPGYDGPEKYMGLTGRSGKVPIQTKPKVPIQKKEVVKLPEKPNNFFAKKRLRRMSESYSERRSNND